MVYQKSLKIMFQTVKSTKSPSEFVFMCCEFTKVILYSKDWCEMFVLKFSVKQNHLIAFIHLFYLYLKIKQLKVNLKSVCLSTYYYFNRDFKIEKQLRRV